LTEILLTPRGEKLRKNENGEPSGILIDGAAEIILHLLPDYTEKAISNQIEIAQKELIKRGLTEIGAIDVLADELHLYLPYFTNSEPKLRAQIYLSAHSDEYLADSSNWHFKNDYVNVRGIKFYADGALGSYGAALLEPYADDGNMMGVHFWSEEEFYAKTKAGLERGFDIATHAIGDSANRMVINVYERLNKEFGSNRPLLRIEHAQLLNPSDQKRLVDNDIIASMQPIHCTSDAKMAEKRLGKDRCKETGYKWKTLLDMGTKIIGGSDYPIESHNPFTGIDAFVNRTPRGDSEPWFKNEVISLEEAVKCYTLYPRQYLGITDRGSIKIGNKADLTIIDNNLRDKSAIYNTQVIATFINGRQVYSKL
jgi:predicted amidohydrolase YtcJ